jgi:hypothetical protein
MFLGCRLNVATYLHSSTRVVAEQGNQTLDYKSFVLIISQQPNGIILMGFFLTPVNSEIGFRRRAEACKN